MSQQNNHWIIISLRKDFYWEFFRKKIIWLSSPNSKISDGGSSQIPPSKPSIHRKTPLASARVFDSGFPERFALVRKSGYCILSRISAYIHTSATRKDILLYSFLSRKSGRFHITLFCNMTLHGRGYVLRNVICSSVISAYSLREPKSRTKKASCFEKSRPLSR